MMALSHAYLLGGHSNQDMGEDIYLSNHKVNPKNKRFSSFLANGPITFLPETVQVSSISFKVFNGCVVEP